MRQLYLIHELLERRRISRAVASIIIDKLVELPEIGASGLEDLKAIQRPQ